MVVEDGRPAPSLQARSSPNQHATTSGIIPHYLVTIIELPRGNLCFKNDLEYDWLATTTKQHERCLTEDAIEKNRHSRP